MDDDLAVPDGHEQWWSTQLDLRWSDLDSYQHVTATVYPVLYAEAVGRFVSEAWRTPTPDFVLARSSFAYLKEIRKDDGPVRIAVAVDGVRRTTFTTSMVLSTFDGRVCSMARSRFAAWDPAARSSRPLTGSERAALT